MHIPLETFRAALARIRPNIVNTACIQSQTLSAQLGCELFIKFENQQFTASFKERGALNCLLRDPEASVKGVIAMSAGNHAQAVADHAQRLGIPATIVMPRSTPNAKVEATRIFGADIHLHGAQFAETLVYTDTLARERGLHLVHPFDNVDVIAGQGTVALEMIDQVPHLDVLVVPVGGGGLIGGVATVYSTLAPDTHIIGVQMRRFPGAYDIYNSKQSDASHPATVAEGIAVKQPGALTMPLIRSHVQQMVLVDEAEVEQAVFDLLEIEKTVAEGAGAAPLAAIRQLSPQLQGKRVGMVLSGGNIDMMILASVLERGLVRSSRLVRLQVEIPDSPGALAKLAAILGELDSNIIDIEQQRTFDVSSVRAVQVNLVLQLRGEEQRDTIVNALKAEGYAAIKSEV